MFYVHNVEILISNNIHELDISIVFIWNYFRLQTASTIWIIRPTINYTLADVNFKKLQFPFLSCLFEHPRVNANIGDYIISYILLAFSIGCQNTKSIVSGLRPDLQWKLLQPTNRNNSYADMTFQSSFFYIKSIYLYLFWLTIKKCE